MSKTIVEKILSRASGVDAHAGQIVTAPVDVMFCHDGNRPLGAEVFDTYGASKVCDAKRVIQIMDHAPSCPTESVAKMHAYMRHYFVFGRTVGRERCELQGVGILRRRCCNIVG